MENNQKFRKTEVQESYWTKKVTIKRYKLLELGLSFTFFASYMMMVIYIMYSVLIILRQGLQNTQLSILSIYYILLIGSLIYFLNVVMGVGIFFDFKWEGDKE